jgi:septum formation protein
VDALIAEGEVFWCAGGLMVEHSLVQPHVTRMDGSLDSVMGLDKRLVLRLLCAAGAAGDGEACGSAGGA